MDLVTFNALPLGSAVAELTGCCSSPDWAQRVASRRPFGTVGELIRCAEQALTELDVLRQWLGNDPATERRVLRAELAKINRIRLTRLVGV